MALSSTSQSFPPSSAYVIRPARSTDSWALRKMRLMTPRSLIANLLVIVLLLIPFITTLYIVSYFPPLGHSKEWDIIAFLLVGMPLTIYLAVLSWVLFFQPLSYAEIWVVESNDMLLGSAQLIQYDTYSYLDQLFIFPAHRNQGFGSGLVNYFSSKEGKKPIYLLCQSDLVKYYRRLGFCSIPKNDLPNELQSKFGYFGYIPLRLM
ncbi:MAG: GNAT family N-acetyltransferase [Gloeobacterales cyanobacterium]